MSDPVGLSRLEHDLEELRSVAARAGESFGAAFDLDDEAVEAPARRSRAPDFRSIAAVVGLATIALIVL